MHWSVNYVFLRLCQELSDMQITTEGQLKLLEMDLQTTRTALTTLRDRNGDLGKASYRHWRVLVR